MKLTPEMLTGKSREHLVMFITYTLSNQFFQIQSVQGFQCFQQIGA